MLKKLIVVMIVSFLFTGMLAFADNGGKAFAGNQLEKGARGVLNGGLGWTEVPKAVLFDGPKKQGWWSVLASPYNCAVGIIKGAVRTAGGIVDTVTFPVGGSVVDSWPMQDLEIE